MKPMIILLRIFAQISRGDKSVFNSDFNYTKVQFSYTQPWQLGGFGRLFTTVEAGKTFGEVPLGLLSVIPGNLNVFFYLQHLFTVRLLRVCV